MPGYPDGAAEAIWALLYGYTLPGKKSLNDFDGQGEVWEERLGLPREDLDETIRSLVV